MANVKNLMVYLNPAKKFNQECELLARVQIDNAISLGLKDDLILVTNFSYDYQGVRATVVGDGHYCDVRPRSIKTSIIPHLIELGIIEKDKIYWNHDLDAFQNEIITEEELGLDGLDAGFTDYGWRSRWCLGSDFIKASAKDIFEYLRDHIFLNIEDETVLLDMQKDNVLNVNSRIKKVNITYQIGMRHIEHNHRKAHKPLKVLHFHPSKPGLLDKFMHGKNSIGIPFMSERLINVFNSHGIK